MLIRHKQKLKAHFFNFTKVKLSPLSPWGGLRGTEKEKKAKQGEKKKSHFIKPTTPVSNSFLLSDFVEIQRNSFFELLKNGLIEEFTKRNPISNAVREIFFYPEYYQLAPPEYNPRRAILLSKSYSSKLFIPAQLTDKKLKKSQLKWVLIGNLPLMTKRGHFVLNGAPRVIVNQILRSPGIYFQGSLKEIFSDQWSEKPDIAYKRFYTDLICLRGTWLRIEIDKNKDIWAQMKKVPKIPLLWFLLAMGLTERIIFKSIINPTRLLANFNLEIKRKLNYQYVTNTSDAWKEIALLVARRTQQKPRSLLVSFFLPKKEKTSPPVFPYVFRPAGEKVPLSLAKLSGSAGDFFLTGKKKKERFYLQNNEKEAKQAGACVAAPPKGLQSTGEKSNPFPFVLRTDGKGTKAAKQAKSAFQTYYRQLYNFPFFCKISSLKIARFRKVIPFLTSFSFIKPKSNDSTSTIFFNSFFLPRNKMLLRIQQKPGCVASPSKSCNAAGKQKLKLLRSSASFSCYAYPKEEWKQLKRSTYSPLGGGTFPSGTKQKQKAEKVKEGRNWIFKRFMNPRAYDLGKQGRLNFNRKLKIAIPSYQTTLTAQDLLFATDYLLKIEKNLALLDDIDHLKNRRVRTSGELLQIQIGIGLIRLEKIIRDNFAKINASNPIHLTHSYSFPMSFLASQVKQKKKKNLFPFLLRVVRSKSPTPTGTGKGKTKGRIKFPFFSLKKKHKPSNEAKLSLAAPPHPSGPPPKGWGGKVGGPKGEKQKGKQKKKKKISKAVPLILDLPLKKNLNSLNSYQKLKTIENLKINNIINTKAFNGALREFFGSSQLSQFMDQLNPLAEITHKRRLSSMGPGGVTRDSATLAIRGIHPTHYGRICPIETPEGKNTGLVNSLTTYARANLQGFLESPFYKVYKGQIQKTAGIFFLSAEQEENIKVAAADLSSPTFFCSKQIINTEVNNCFRRPPQAFCSKERSVLLPGEGGCRKQRSRAFFFKTNLPTKISYGLQSNFSFFTNCNLFPSGIGRIGFLPKSKMPAKIVSGDMISKITRPTVEYIGVSPIQMISIATSLIPFLEHDDANRALMGSNMQRQAVPLLRAERPLVGTGLESRVVSDSGHVVIAKESGYVTYVSAKKIITRSNLMLNL